MIFMGYIYLYYGTGGGKTTASLGLALRSLGHGHRVVIVQFLKYWKNTGEYKISKCLGPQYVIRQFGRKGWIKTSPDDDEVNIRGFRASVRDTTEEDRATAKKALRYAEKVIKADKPPELLILDEVCLATALGIINTADVLDLLKKLPEATDIVLTGRCAPKELIDRADFVNEVREVKSPDLFVSREGIQY